ncbi:phasin family protein [Rhodospirillum sp. A1_3_36]|uniref:phasin family protein n=1 Tax=Rhodospirillum sp. A1_3_36 TaxID=3391666 RepID=UPI0039A651AD
MMKSYEDIVKFNKDNMDAAVAAGTTFAKGVEDLSKEYFGYASKSFDTAMEATKALTSCKSPTEAAALQQKLTKEGFEGFMAESKKMSEMTTALFKGAFEPVGARAKVAMDSVGIKA